MTPFKYLKAETEEQAIQLLDQALPMGGGSWLAAHRDEIKGIVDLKQLELDRLTEKKGQVKIGAGVSIQQLLEFSELDALKRVLKLELGWNMRNQATVAGVLVSSSGRSPLASVMLALDAQLNLVPGNVESSLDQYLDREGGRKQTGLITQIGFRLPTALTYDQVARAPRDRPMVSVSVARYERRELHIALGGHGNRPIRLPEAEQAFRDGAKAESLAGYARAAFQGSDDAWASGDYRSDVAATLLHRALQEVS